MGVSTGLLKANVPVTIELNIETKFYGDHEHGFDTVAEIPGTDPKLKDEIVMVGGHLDSWISATGATDNGAGSVVAMEVMRILNALHVKPRRTIRVALWTGEEQGLHWFTRLCHPAIWLRTTFHRAGPAQAQRVYAQSNRPATTETGAAEGFWLLQRGQRQRKNSWRVLAGQCRDRANFCAVDCAVERPWASPR